MKNWSKPVIMFLAVGVLLMLAGSRAWAHCQIPCGIYTDEMRFQMIEEDLKTIEKSMSQIEKLSAATPVNFNQLVRWINNKDEHASKIQSIIDKYFLTQRVKPVEPAKKAAYMSYTNKLALLHQILFYAMKCKQTTDATNVAKIRQLLNDFHNAYFGPTEKEHLKEHH